MGVDELKNIGPFLSMAYIFLQDADYKGGSRELEKIKNKQNDYGNLCLCPGEKAFYNIELPKKWQTISERTDFGNDSKELTAKIAIIPLVNLAEEKKMTKENMLTEAGRKLLNDKTKLVIEDFGKREEKGD